MVGIFYTTEIKVQKYYRSGFVIISFFWERVLVVWYSPAQDPSKAIGDKDLIRAS